MVNSPSNNSEKSPRNLSQGPKSVNQGVSGQSGQVVKAAGTMSGMTLGSRILGMIRDIVCARSFGTSWQWDGFIYAFMIPNFFRRLVAEGTLSAAFVPIYSEILERRGKEEAYRFANAMLSLLACGLLLFVLLMEGLTTLAVAFIPMPETLRLALDLMRFFFPYLMLMSIFALGMGVLHSHRHFVVPALGPIILNLFWIGGVWFGAQWVGDQPVTHLRWVSIAILFAGVTQVLTQLMPLHRLGFRIHWSWGKMAEDLKRTWNLMVPAIIGFAVVPLNVLVDMTIGLWIGEGANSSLWYGNRLMQFPLAIFAIAMGTALLPTLSRSIAAGEHKQAEETLRFSCKTVFLIVLPSTIGLMVLAEPIVKMLFERGAFDASSTLRTSRVLIFYCVGLFAYSGQKMIISAFYAHQNTTTPAKIAGISLLLNIVLNLLLMHPLQEAGLALATSLSAIIQLMLLLIYYQRNFEPLKLGEINAFFLKILGLSALMGAATYYVYDGMTKTIPLSGFSNVLVSTLGAIVFAKLLFWLLCWVARVKELWECLDLLKR